MNMDMNMAMDQEKSPHSRDTQPTVSPSPSPSPPPPSDRILDRKIEKRGLTQGFSSNLARKGMSTARKVSDRSVRDMVTLFEESATASKNKSSDSPGQAACGATPETRDHDGNEDCRGGNNSSKHGNSGEKPAAALKQRQSEKSQHSGIENTTTAMAPHAQGGYQIEECSLTLLKHKCYFNNRPLGRCLDDDRPEKGSQTRIQRVRSKKEAENKNDETGNKSSVPLDNAQTSAPVQQLDSLMSELLNWQGAMESSKPGPDQWRESRDRDSDEGFWKNVRTKLWVDEEEIYEAKIEGTAGTDSTNVSVMGSECLEMKPSISASTLHASFFSDIELGTELELELELELEPELPPPPMPTRLPPPVPPPSSPMPPSPASQSLEQDSAAPSQDPTSNHPQEDPPWDDLPTPSFRTSISAIDDISNLSSRGSPEPTLPIPLPIPTTHHARYPSIPWTRPPTWRSPSSLRSSSPPPALPPQLPMGTPPNPVPRPRSNHARARHRTHSSSAKPPSLPTAHSLADRSSGGRTPATSTSSVATWGRSSGTAATTDRSSASCSPIPAATAAAGGAAGVPPQPRQRRLPTEDSYSFVAAAAMMPHPPRRRLTSEESFSPGGGVAGVAPHPTRRRLTSEESFSPSGGSGAVGGLAPARRRLTSEESFSPGGGAATDGVIAPPPRRRLVSEESFSPSAGRGAVAAVAPPPPPRRRLTSEESFPPGNGPTTVPPLPRRRGLTTEESVSPPRAPTPAPAPAPALQPPPRRRRFTTEDDAAGVVPPPPPRRRLTTEEKLWEIDAFLSSSADGVEGREGWI